jgi:hypothetical protein
MNRVFTKTEAKGIGEMLGVNFNRISLEQFRIGLSVELEHGLNDTDTNITYDDEYLTGKIAWAHLKEIPDYYRRLAEMEQQASHKRKFSLSKR